MSRSSVRPVVRANPVPRTCEKLIEAIFERLKQPLEILARVEAAAGGLAMGDGSPVPVEVRKAHLLNGLQPSARSPGEREQIARKLGAIYRELEDPR